MNPFVTYCKQYIYCHIDDYRGKKVYLCDLGFTLTEYPNCTGTLTYSREEAKNYIREWWDDADYYFQYEKDNFGTPRSPFENPEAYMVCMVIEGVRALIDDAVDTLGMNDQWNDEVELTADLIEEIIGAVKEYDDERLF